MRIRIAPDEVTGESALEVGGRDVPRRYHDRHLAHGTVGRYARAHWLRTDRAPGGRRADPSAADRSLPAIS
ncbi:hypothetical protein ACIRP7_23640 [Streptomyces sp. NPDC102270]|uniref:hypothetical protein n=1 Tax=Streptomyces sp. NPDC102270 TaxID=3366150 RepID=UPI0037F601FA